MTMMSKENLSSPPRERVSVGITGIDRSTPDDLVKDGKCEELHNARYEAEAWRPVHPYMLSKSVPNLPITHKIVYKHPAAPENIYIVESFVNGKYYYDAYDITKPFMEQGAMIPLVKQSEVQMTISHFGNVLMLTGENTTLNFILKKGVYTQFVIPPYMRTEVSSYKSSFPHPTQVRTGDRQAGFGYPWEEYDTTNMSGTNDPWDYRGVWFPIHNITQDIPLISGDGDMWNGEVLLFTTWRMADGTNLSPSPLHLLKSYDSPKDIPEGYTRSISIAPSPRELFIARQNGEETSSLDKYLAISIQANNLAEGGVLAPKTEQFTRRWVPNIRVNIPTDADTSSATHIAIWVTRIHPIFKTSASYRTTLGRDNNFQTKPSEIVTLDNSFTGFYDTTNLADQPFYLLKEIPIEDIADNDNKRYVDITLTASLLANVVSNAVYTPNNNIHSITSGVSLDYNNRLHYASTQVTLADSYNLGDGFSSEDETWEMRDMVDVEIDNNTYSILSKSMRNTDGVSEKSPYTHILSYPDYRAKSIRADGVGAFTFRPATANNFAWFHAPHTEQEKYPAITKEQRTIIMPEELGNKVVKQPNRIQVSAPNNPFSFPFENSYNVGSVNNRIIAMQSAAIEMPEMKVGEMPLYVFTTEGIFALIAGQNTLYASVAAINYDKIINPNTLAINGAIVYITEKGVHLLTNNGTQVISTPIHDKANRPPLDFLRTCKMIYPKERNEIILHKETLGKGIAYIYNLDAGYWSTRDLAGYKLNTDELYAVNNNIYDLANEDESKALEARIETRPIKLGNVEFKRLETIIPRLATGEHPIEFKMSVDGSVDGTTYMPMRSVNIDFEANRVNPITIRRTPFSAKYIKMAFNLSPVEENYNPSFSHIDIEWYRKLPHRMR